MTRPDPRLLYETRAAIAYVLYSSSQAPGEECYASKILRRLPNEKTTLDTVINALNDFEAAGLITTVGRTTADNRVKIIEVTEDGEFVFRKLVGFMNAVDYVRGCDPDLPPVDTYINV